MANTRLIEEYIRDSGYKLRHVARALNISESAAQQTAGADPVQTERSRKSVGDAGNDDVGAGCLLF